MSNRPKFTGDNYTNPAADDGINKGYQFEPSSILTDNDQNIIVNNIVYLKEETERIESKKETDLANHNSNANAHQVIRANVTAAQTRANDAHAAIAVHEASSTAHEDLRIAVFNPAVTSSHSSGDMNSFTEPGLYSFTSLGWSSNIPSEVAHHSSNWTTSFLKATQTGTLLTQKLIVIPGSWQTTSNLMIFERIMNNNIWHNWRETSASDNWRVIWEGDSTTSLSSSQFSSPSASVSIMGRAYIVYRITFSAEVIPSGQSPVSSGVFQQVVAYVPTSGTRISNIGVWATATVNNESSGSRINFPARLEISPGFIMGSTAGTSAGGNGLQFRFRRLEVMGQ